MPSYCVLQPWLYNEEPPTASPVRDATGIWISWTSCSHWPWLISQGVVAKNARAFWNVPGRLGDVARCCILPRWVHGNTIKRQHVSTGIGIHDNQPLDLWIEFDYAYGILGQMQMFLKLSHGREHMGSILFQDATWGSRKAQLCKPKLGAHVSSDPTDTV